MHSINGKFLVPVSILLGAVAIAVTLVLTKPAPKAAEIEHKPLLINATKAVKQDLRIYVRAQGTISPRTITTLVAEVSGTINDVSPRFKTGGFFKKGEMLLHIDQRDYFTELKRAKAAVASATSNLASEQGRAEVAYQDWIKYKSKVTRSKAATDLALRKPQLADAQATLDAAIADMNHAQNRLDRTIIRAPYDGLVNSKQVDIGQYVNTGSILAKTFAVDVAELRLALPENRLNYLSLPNITNNGDNFQPSVDLYTQIGDQVHQWKAKLVRTEGVFDERSRVLFAVAQIQDPYGLKTPQKEVLRIGTFVDARIEGKVIPNLIRLPRHLLRAGNRVWVIDPEQRLQNRQVKILRTQGEDIYVQTGLEEGELVSLSNISDIIEGTQVRIASITSTDEIKIEPTKPEPDIKSENNFNVTPAATTSSQQQDTSVDLKEKDQAV